MIIFLVFLWLAALIASVLLLSVWALGIRVCRQFRTNSTSPTALGVQLKQQLRPRRVVVVGSCLTVALVALMAGNETWLTRQRLRRSALTADRFVLRTGGNCHRRMEEEITLFESRNPSELQKVVDRISFSPELFPVSCRCCGDMTFEFYRTNALQVSFSLHHNQRIRIPGEGERALSSTSADALVSWLAEVGATQKLTKHKDELEKQRRIEWETAKAEIEAEAARVSGSTNGNSPASSETKATPPAAGPAR